MSSIKRMARVQKKWFGMAARYESSITNGKHTARFRVNAPRRAANRIKEALLIEESMISSAMERPEDSESWRNFDLVGAIHQLTLSRINRLAYAGRVLP